MYLINALKSSKELEYLQLYLPSNNITLNKDFFEHIWRSLHGLEYLHLLYLNVFQNKVLDVRDIHDFLNSILFSTKGFYCKIAFYV